MTEVNIQIDGSGTGAGTDDAVLPFQVEGLDVRGRLVRLGPQLDRLLKRHAYPAPVARVVAEAVTLTVMLGTSLKLTGRFQMQTKSDGPIGMIVVDFDAPNRMRAYAQFDPAEIRPGASAADLIGKGHLALTIDQGGAMNRYQGVVPLDGLGLEAAAHQYFLQSEQIPTRIRLAVGEVAAAGNVSWRAGGLFVQFLPEAPERMRQPDLPPGDVPEGTASPSIEAEDDEDDAWTEAKALAGTVEDHELLDPSLSSERLLYRLFHERGVRAFETQAIIEACRCSEDRIRQMLQRFSRQERADMLDPSGKIAVTCEFCSTGYSIAPDSLPEPDANN
jgi:molecular chaperone Hsp33